MRINKMTATFGNLENSSLTLGDGLNVIYAPNESGKSTWCAFIRAMLYGIDSSQREKAGFKPDKVRFAPWSGSPMCGEMEITAGGSRISFIRRTKTASSPMKDFSAVYTGTAQRVEGLIGADAGAQLTGMSKTVFESSVFVRQSGLGVTGSEELEKRISSIVSTGEEDTSYTAADKQLRSWLRKRRYNKSGWMPAVETEIAEQETRIQTLSGAVQEQKSLEERLRRTEERRAALSAAVAVDGQRLRQKRLQSVSDSRENVSRAEEALASAREKAAAMKAGLDSGVFAGKTAEDAEAAAKLELSRLEEMEKRVPKKLPAWILFALGLILGIVGIYTLIPLIIAGAAAEIAGAFVMYNSRRKALEAQKAAAAFCIKYDVAAESGIQWVLEQYAKKYAAWSRARDEVGELTAALENARAAQAEADRSLLSEGGDENALAHLEALKQAETDIALLRQNIALYEGKFGALGDPMVMRSQLEGMRERLFDLQGQYDALNLAISTLKEANDEMQARFSPQLSRRAGEIMGELTGNRYDRLVFDRELNALARRAGDTAGRETAFLSSGTADQLYLALRLAICELALPEGNSCPIILDDALVNFDDERMGFALDMLERMSEKRQIILFTCHDREEKYIASRRGAEIK